MGQAKSVCSLPSAYSQSIDRLQSQISDGRQACMKKSRCKSRSRSPISFPCVTFLVNPEMPAFLEALAEGQRYSARGQERKGARRTRQQAGKMTEGEQPLEDLAHVSIAVASMKALASDPNCPDGPRDRINDFLFERPEQQLRWEIQLF